MVDRSSAALSHIAAFPSVRSDLPKDEPLTKMGLQDGPSRAAVRDAERLTSEDVGRAGRGVSALHPAIAKLIVSKAVRVSQPCSQQRLRSGD